MTGRWIIGAGPPLPQGAVPLTQSVSGAQERPLGKTMRVAHFVHRYPPALGGAESYFARLSDYLTAAGDQVTVFTTTAVDLEYFATSRGRRLRSGQALQDGVTVRRYGLLHVPFQP